MGIATLLIWHQQQSAHTSQRLGSFLLGHYSRKTVSEGKQWTNLYKKKKAFLRGDFKTQQTKAEMAAAEGRQQTSCDLFPFGRLTEYTIHKPILETLQNPGYQHHKGLPSTPLSHWLTLPFTGQQIHEVKEDQVKVTFKVEKC